MHTGTPGTGSAEGAWRVGVKALRHAGLALIAGAVAAAGQPLPPAPVAPSAPAASQVDAPTPASSPQAVTFGTGAGALLAVVKPEKTAEFEALLSKHRQALQAQGEAGEAAARAWTVYRASEPAPGGANVLYLILIDPADSTADYSWQKVLATLYAAWPEQAAEFFGQATSVYAGPLNKLTLTRIAPVP